MDVASLINEYGFPIVATVGLGYFIYYVWQFVTTELDPKLEEMHIALIRVIDKTRMLDQDMIRLQQKVNVVLEYRARQEVLKNAELEKEKESKK